MKGKKIGILIGVSAVVVAVGASVTVTQQNEYKLIRLKWSIVYSSV